MKKHICFVAFLILVCTLALSACNSGQENTLHEHTYSEWVTIKESNCTEYGVQERSCSCGDIQTQNLTYYKHIEVLIPYVSPTCTETGFTAGKYCSLCNKTLVSQSTILAKGHTEVIDKAVEATCTETGLTEGKHCSTCKAVFVPQTVVEEKGHEEVVDKAVDSTCSKVGLTEGKHCSVCKVILIAQNKTTKKEHTEVVDKAVESTCSQAGLTEGLHCSVCGEVIVSQQKTAKKAHIESDWIIDKKATIKEEGKKHKECLVCKSTIQTETIPKSEYSEGLEFAFDSGNNTYYVSKIGTCTDTDIIIPNTYNGYDVRAIGSYAFVNCTSIKSITIPRTVKVIREGAFKNCTSLETITFMGGDIKFSNYIFKGCSSIEKIDFKEWTGWWYYAISDCAGCFDYTNNKYKIYCTDAMIDSSGRVYYYQSNIIPDK